MKNLNKEHNLTRQNENKVQHSQKHDANLQKNSTLYFQVGLILCLLAVYGALEMPFESTNLAVIEESVEPVFEEYTLVFFWGYWTYLAKPCCLFLISLTWNQY